ncbi:MAG: amino acid permease [Pseudorhodoplanes sp.]|nr:putative amino acid permease YhdG [Pseudorhodoplanes sp.]MBW7949677.1 amino acid permease [Pseudorhodoplanes sp.]MCL4711428.1 amino acid permease [Pseudorhodoplanes sp.]MCQ3942036.1 amino acid permease [Alphaproteobacteria bacterium]GIK79168.1 MAG: amino acid transporter [Alphaproteobacteria bacterium]
MSAQGGEAGRQSLRRRINLPLLVLYGVGVTVGAGIYVLIGAMVRHAGVHAPLAFLMAAVVMALTAASYAELCTRFPVSAGEAAYVRAAFRSRTLSRLVGLLTIVIGIVSGAAVSIGCAGYLREFVDWPIPLLVVLIVLGLGAIAAFGILESVTLAGIFTLIEVGGLLAIIGAGFDAGLDLAGAVPQMFAVPFDQVVWSGIAMASLLAFFAFIGFEDLVNIAEEAQAPGRDLPLAIALTLVISTVLYVLVAVIAVVGVPAERLTQSSAPLSVLFREIAGISPAAITAIAIVATLNTVLVQMTMASRVLYGMARQNDLPAVLGDVHAHTATPLLATAIATGATLVLALTIPIEPLAEATSIATLVVFAMVNASLIRLRLAKRPHGPAGTVRIPLWVPVLGLVSCMAMIAGVLL